MIQAVIFDFNGVLVDDEHLHCELFREILEQEGISLTDRQYHEDYLGYDDRGCFQAVLNDAGLDADASRLDELIARKAARYLVRAREGLRYFGGASRTLSTLSERWPLAICSGALRPEIKYALDQLGMRDRVGVIISAEDASRCKPDPQGYLLALEGLRSAGRPGLAAGDCLVVEDSLAGLASGKAAGMRTVGIAQTYSPRELQEAGPDAVLDELAGLTPAWIERTFGASGGGGRDDG